MQGHKSKEIVDFLENNASIVTLPNGNKWYYLPCWFKKHTDDLVEQFPFSKLPQELKDTIQSHRDGL